MREVQNFKYSTLASTSSANYHASTTAINFTMQNVVSTFDSNVELDFDGNGKYSVESIANWFLNKSPMTHKKVQKLCYYAQAWCYALKGFRLIDTDFQAWVHGPVSPALYEKFRQFGYDTIKLSGSYTSDIDAEDERLLDDVWETYGDRTGNALESLTHREMPWIKARRGYASNERCTVTIAPRDMMQYYKSIYIGE